MRDEEKNKDDSRGGEQGEPEERLNVSLLVAFRTSEPDPLRTATSTSIRLAR